MAGTLDRLGTDLRLHLTRNPLQKERQEDNSVSKQILLHSLTLVVPCSV